LGELYHWGNNSHHCRINFIFISYIV